MTGAEVIVLCDALATLGCCWLGLSVLIAISRRILDGPDWWRPLDQLEPEEESRC